MYRWAAATAASAKTSQSTTVLV